ncbi:unnamed protein product, partial [Allacma fusca]
EMNHKRFTTKVPPFPLFFRNGNDWCFMMHVFESWARKALNTDENNITRNDINYENPLLTLISMSTTLQDFQRLYPDQRHM